MLPNTNVDTQPADETANSSQPQLGVGYSVHTLASQLQAEANARGEPVEQTYARWQQQQAIARNTAQLGVTYLMQTPSKEYSYPHVYTSSRSFKELTDTLKAFAVQLSISKPNLPQHCLELANETIKLERDFPQHHGFYCNVIAAALDLIDNPVEKNITRFKELAAFSKGIDNMPPTRLQKLSGLILTIASIATLAISTYVLYSAGITIAAFGIYAFPYLPKNETPAEIFSREGPPLLATVGIAGSLFGVAKACTLFGGSPAVPTTQMNNLAADITLKQPRAI